MKNTLLSRMSLAAIMGICFLHTANAQDSNKNTLMSWSIPEKSIPLEHPIYDKPKTGLEETRCKFQQILLWSNALFHLLVILIAEMIVDPSTIIQKKRSALSRDKLK